MENQPSEVEIRGNSRNKRSLNRKSIISFITAGNQPKRHRDGIIY